MAYERFQLVCFDAIFKIYMQAMSDITTWYADISKGLIVNWSTDCPRQTRPSFCSPSYLLFRFTGMARQYKADHLWFVIQKSAITGFSVIALCMYVGPAGKIRSSSLKGWLSMIPSHWFNYDIDLAGPKEGLVEKTHAINLGLS